MKNASAADEDPRETRALARFAAVQTVLQALQQGLAFYQALARAAALPWEGRLYSPRTIEEWFYRYRDGKFAALQGSGARRDKGTHRALDAAAVQALCELRRAHPHLAITALAAELERRGVLTAGTYGMATLHRRLAQAGLDRRSLRAGAGGEAGRGPTKAFELPLPNLLWMADCMHGPTLRHEDGSAQRTFLFALIDDCSRLCPHGQFYGEERLWGFLDTLRQAVQTRGLPDKLYTDNGACFTSQHLGIVCANLGIRLLHCRPYHAWSKGKIERLFASIQTQFLPTLAFAPVHDLAELNRRFWQWLETDYHQREHSALAGESPAQRFARLGTALRLLEPGASLERLLRMRVQRRVRKDATFSLGATFWEVPAHLRGQIIEVHFDPVRPDAPVDVYFAGRSLGPARRCHKQQNARLRPPGNEYDHGTF